LENQCFRSTGSICPSVGLLLMAQRLIPWGSKVKSWRWWY